MSIEDNAYPGPCVHPECKAMLVNYEHQAAHNNAVHQGHGNGGKQERTDIETGKVASNG